MMYYLALAVIIFTAMRLITAASNLVFRQWLHGSTPSAEPKVSILIPARNEEQNIRQILESIMRQSYQNWEAIVYDDLSEDQTARIVSRLAAKDDRIRLVRSQGLPDGWRGKNHACHQLAREATGTYLLYLDADVIAGKPLLKDAVSHLQNHKLDLLSIFPYQIMKNFGEKITVPLMHWVLVSLLPLILTKNTTIPSLSAANGQFMLFKGDTYRRFRFHEKMKNYATEDIVIARYMKHKGLRTHTLLSRHQVKCRMYRSFREAVQGFSRTMIAFFGGHSLLTLAYALVTTFGVIPVWASLGASAAAMYLAATLLIRILVSIAGKQNVFLNFVTAPVQQVVFLIIAIKAIYNKTRKKTIWKGRLVEN